jgi:GntR family transcriptional regulator
LATKRDRVVHSLRELIRSGTLLPGQRVPTEASLAEQHGVAIGTARAAVAQLVAEGSLYTEHGSGSYVRDQSTITRCANKRLSTAERQEDRGAHLSDAQGRPTTITTRVYVTRASVEQADALNISPGAEVLVRDRVMGIGGQPTQLAVSVLPRSLTSGTAIEQEDTGQGGLLARLIEAGHDLAPHVERVRLHRATADEAARLQVPPGSAVLRVARTTSDTKGTVLEVNTMTLVDRYELVYEIPAE